MELQFVLNLTLAMSEDFFYCFFVCFFLGKIGGVVAWLELDIANVGGVFYCFYLFFCLFLWKK